ncbi:WD40 repeat-like protein [Phlebopus sp. FC_14]|nr:WD40 repeat-like protein [Phlebopus sp. FC_14]
MTGPITITADEVNCLIHAYFQDSGFQHSAFSLRMEGRLDHSHHIKKHIPRGELVELLSKALLYSEVEAHWKGDALATTCKGSFSLLEHHVCSIDSNSNPVPASHQPGESNTLRVTGEKRKSGTPSTEDGRAEKRARKDAEDKDTTMVVDGMWLLVVGSSECPEVILVAAAKSKEVRSPIDSQSAHSEVIVKKSKSKRPPLPEAVRFLEGHKSEVFVVAWSPSAAGHLISGSRDAAINYWEVPSGSYNHTSASQLQPVLTLANLSTSGQADLTSLDWNHDGSLVAIGSYDSALRIYTAFGKLHLADSHHKGPIFAAKFSLSGQWVVTASLDSTSCVWDVKNKRLHRQYRNHEACCLDVDWLDDSTFASCGSDRVVHVVSLSGTKPLRTLRGHTGEINMIKCNPSRTCLASCSDDATARIWSIENIHAEKSFPASVILQGHKQCLTSIKWCPHNLPGGHELVATASFDCTARLWDAVTGDCLKTFTDHSKHVYSLSFSPDGGQLVTGGGDGAMHMYDVKARKRIWSWSSGEKAGIFEIDWKKWGENSLIALAMEHRIVAVVDPTKAVSNEAL